MWLLLACDQASLLEPEGHLYSGGEPDIVVEPTAIDFGGVAVGDSVTETVTVSDVGDAALQIESLSLADPDAPFAVSAITSVLVPVQGSATFTVTFAPLASSAAPSAVQLVSNDPDEPIVEIALVGEPISPVIEVDPFSYPFGDVPIGCDERISVWIANVGNDDLVIDAVGYVTASTDLTLDRSEGTNGLLPWTLTPGEAREIYVAYAPMDEVEDEGFVTIGSNDHGQGGAMAYQTGAGVSTGVTVDTFVQPYRSVVDILFVIDDNASMEEEAANVVDNLAAFATALTATGVDYQLGVITANDPTFRGDVITAATTDPEVELVAQGTVGYAGEQGGAGLAAAYEATQAGMDAGPGSAFLRERATLAFVSISDTADASAGFWYDYVVAFQALKPDPDNVAWHGIGGDYPTGCGGADAGLGYYEASVATGGDYLSICATDWASTLAAAFDVAIGERSFELSSWPVPGTIVVTVDGVVVEGWTYNMADNTVELDEAPEDGAVVEITYVTYGDCDP